MIEKMLMRSRTTEADSVGTQIIDAYNGTALKEDASLAEMMAVLTGLSGKLNQAIKRIKSESQLEDKDELRDDAIRSFHFLLRGYTYHADVNVRNAAMAVQEVFERYGLGIISEAYSSQSSLVNSLLSDLGLTSLQAPLALLPGIEACITAIRNAQHEFETNYLAYEADKAAESTYINATGLKKQLIEQVNYKLLVYLNAMLLVNDAEYGDFARIVGQIISDSNEAVRRRSKKVVQEDL